MMVSFLLFSLAWTIGTFAGSLFLIQPLIILFFGIPFTLKLHRLGFLIDLKPLKMYILAFIFQITIFAAISFGIYKLLPASIVGYWIGAGIAFIFGIGKCGYNEKNLSDYCNDKTNIKSMNSEVLQKYSDEQYAEILKRWAKDAQAKILEK